MKIIGYITTFLVTAFLSCVWSGYVLSVLWNWFVVPPFHAPSLTIGSAVGLSMVVTYFTFVPAKNTENKSFGELLLDCSIMAVIKPALALFCGSIVHVFVG